MIGRKRFPFIVFAFITAASAYAAQDAPAPAPKPHAADPDLAALEAQLEAAERGFAAAATGRDLAAFRSFLTAQTVFVTPHGNLRGPDAILAQWAAFFAPDGPSIRWEPQRVAVVEDGTVGLTSGPYWIEAPNPEGGRTKYTGTFVSTWRRDANGAWRILLDTGTDAEPE